MNTNKSYKLASKVLRNIELDRTANKIQDLSDSNSNSDSDSIIKQEKCRSKPLKTPAHKKRALDKDLQTKKPHIDTNTGKWLCGYPYHLQY